MKDAQPQQQKQCADTGALCPYARRAGPCPAACTAPDRCLMWGLGAAPTATHRRRLNTTTLAASVLHLCVAAAAVAALIFIVKTAAGA